MTEAVCARCQFGLIPGMDSALKNAVIKRDGFRPITVKVHHREHVCRIVLMKREEWAKGENARIAKENVWWRRIKRRVWPR